MEKIRLKLKAYDHRVLDRSVASIIEAVKITGIKNIPVIVKKVGLNISLNSINHTSFVGIQKIKGPLTRDGPFKFLYFYNVWLYNLLFTSK